MDKTRAKRLLAQKKRAGKTETQARTEVARETGWSADDLTAISFVDLSSSDCGSSYDSGSAGSYDSGSSSSSDSGSSSCDSGSF